MLSVHKRKCFCAGVAQFRVTRKRNRIRLYESEYPTECHAEVVARPPKRSTIRSRPCTAGLAKAATVRGRGALTVSIRNMMRRVARESIRGGCAARLPFVLSTISSVGSRPRPQERSSMRIAQIDFTRCRSSPWDVSPGLFPPAARLEGETRAAWLGRSLPSVAKLAGSQMRRCSLRRHFA